MAGLSLTEYASAPQWKRIYFDQAARRAIEIQMAQKEAEVKAIGYWVAQTVGKMFS